MITTLLPSKSWIFFDGDQRPEYVPWTDVQQVDFDRPPEPFVPSNRLP